MSPILARVLLPGLCLLGAAGGAAASTREEARASTGDAFHVYVSNEHSGEVAVIDGASHELLRTIPVGKRPRGIKVSADGLTLYVATSGSPRMGPGADPERARSAVADKSADGIAIIDLRAGAVARRLDVGSDPEEFALSRDGRSVIVSNEDIGEASIWDIETGRLVAKATVSGEPEGVALHPTRDAVYITCEEEGEIYVLHSHTAERITHFKLGGRPRTVAFSADGRRAYIPLEMTPEVAVIDAMEDRFLEKITLPTPALPMGAVLSPDGRELHVTTGRGQHLAVIDVETRRVVETIRVGARPWGLATSPDGALVFTANGTSHDVSVVDVRGRRELKRIPTGEGSGPWGVAIGPVVRPRE